MPNDPTVRLPDDRYPGLYRGMVEFVGDTENVGRYKVRVLHVHETDTPVENLPWAESLALGGRGFGDIPNYDVDDLVMVMFEQGHRDYPYVVGSWVSKRDGINDVNPERTVDFENDRKRWQRTDRRGNLIEMSERDDDLWVRIKSGDSEIVVTQRDESVLIEAKGSVDIKAEQCRVTSSQTTLVSDDITLEAKGKSEDDDGEINLFSNDRIKVWAASTVWIGQYFTKDVGPVAKQSQLVRVQPRVAQVGVKSPTDESRRTLTVNVEGHAAVNVESNSKVFVQAPNIEAKAGTLARVEAPRIEASANNIDVEATGKVFIRTTQFQVRGL